MPLVTKWTGREVGALCEAVRMSLMEFAEKLGVSDRIVSRWEADGEQVTLRMVNQAALDTLLPKAELDAQGRFVGILAADDIPTQAVIERSEDQTSSGEYVKHPGDGKLMAYIPGGIFLSEEDDDPVWVDDFHIDTFPTTNADYARFCAATQHPVPEHWERVDVPVSCRPPRCARDVAGRECVRDMGGEIAANSRTVGKGGARQVGAHVPVGATRRPRRSSMSERPA